MALSTAIAEEAPPPHFPTPDDVRVTRSGDTFRIEIDMTTAVPPASAWRVLTDFDGMASFIPNVERSRVVDRNGNRLRVEQQGRAWFGPFSMSFGSTRDIELMPIQEIRARQISGTAKGMSSTMKLMPAGSGTRLEYRAELVPDGSILPAMVGAAAIRHETAEQFSAILREMLRRDGRSG